MIRWLILTVFAWNTYATECDKAVTPPVRALLGIVSGALKRGDLQLQELESSIDGGKFRNPFEQSERSIENLEARRGFARTAGRMTAKQKSSYLTQVKKVIEVRKGQVKAVAIAREQTAEIVGFGRKEEIPHNQAVDDFVQGTFKGRPVFIGKLEIGSHIQTVMLDRLNDDSEKRLVPLESSEISGRQSLDGSVMQWKGRDYFINTIDYKAFDLEMGGPAKDFPPLHSPKEGAMSLLKNIIYPSGDGVMMLSSWLTGEAALVVGGPTALVLLGSGANGEKPHTLSDRIGNLPTKVFHINGRALYIEVPKPESIQFFDVTEGPLPFAKLTTQPSNTTGWHFKSDQCLPMPFFRDGTWFAYVRYFDVNTNRYFVGLFDLKKNRHLRIVNASARLLQNMEYLEINGHPYAIFTSEGSIAVYDMITEKEMWSTGPSNWRSHATFKFHGETFVLLSANGTPHLQIRDLKSGTVRDEIKFSGRPVNQILTFADEEQKPSLLITRFPPDRPIFVRLGMRENL